MIGKTVHVFSGTADPLCGGGRLTDLVVGRYRSAGLTNVKPHYYPGERHEVLTETNPAEAPIWPAQVTK